MGKIFIDALWVDENDTSSLASNIAHDSAKDYAVGMAVGTDGSGASVNSTAINQQGGEITLYNSGAGMAAMKPVTLLLTREL